MVNGLSWVRHAQSRQDLRGGHEGWCYQQLMKGRRERWFMALAAVVDDVERAETASRCETWS